MLSRSSGWRFLSISAEARRFSGFWDSSSMIFFMRSGSGMGGVDMWRCVVVLLVVVVDRVIIGGVETGPKADTVDDAVSAMVATDR